MIVFPQKRIFRILVFFLKKPHFSQAHHGNSYLLGQYPCHAFLGDSQYFTLSFSGELRNEYMCAERQRPSQEGGVNKVAMSRQLFF